MLKNKLYVLEGSDGSGKTTQVNLAKQYLEDEGFKTEFFHFPAYGTNDFSKTIAKYLQGELNVLGEPYFVANLYAMDRFMFKNELNKMIQRNDVVILDRYILSNIAYQGALFQSGSEDLREEFIHWDLELELDFLELPKPDLNILLQCPNEIIEKRIQQRNEKQSREYLEGKKDIYEDINFLEKVNHMYKYIYEYFRKRLNMINVYSTHNIFDSSGNFLRYGEETPENIFEKQIKPIINYELEF